MKKMMVLMAVAGSALSAFCAETHLALDSRTGTRYARAEEPIAFGTDWVEDATRLVLKVGDESVVTATSATNGVYVWRPDFSSNREVELKLTIRGAANEALAATFTTAAYDVSFDAGAHGAFTGGGAVAQRVPYGGDAVVPTVAPDAGWRFTGWSANPSNVTGNVSAVAQYEAIAYAITYENLYGATHANPSTYTIEDTVAFTAPGGVPRRRFVRWEPASIAVGSTGAVTVRAVWDVTPCVYVDAAHGSDSNDGSTAERTVKTLARAYELAEAGDVIVVAAGTYDPVTAKGKAVTFRADDGATIDGEGTTRCVTADDEVVFENFTIRNGYDADAGGGVKGGTFVGCTIRDCVSEWDGGGAYEAILRNCRIESNEAVNGWGGGACGGTLVGCIVVDNLAGDEGGGVYAPESLVDTILRGNLPEDVAGMSVAGTVSIGGTFLYAPTGDDASYTVSHDWLVTAGLAKYGDSTSTLAAKLAAEYAPGYTGWEAYVVGLTTPTQIFEARVECVDGEVHISWTPNLNTNAVARIYTVYGRTKLDAGDWETPVRPWHRFFKVAVAMPTGNDGEETAVAGEGFIPGELGGVQLWEGGPYWAECNVGATRPEEYGYYFWWGDTVGYTCSGGSWDSYQHRYYGVTWKSSKGTRMSSSPFDYTCPTYDKDDATLLSEGYIDSTGKLAAAHDAATVHLGAPWRMPTVAEWLALISNCTTAWITTNGVYGRLVTGVGSYSKKSIFLPAAGYGGWSSLGDLGSCGDYWSSTPVSGYSGIAWDLYFGSDFFSWSSGSPIFGHSVRPLRGFAQ